jgi:hypothetical protein
MPPTNMTFNDSHRKIPSSVTKRWSISQHLKLPPWSSLKGRLLRFYCIAMVATLAACTPTDKVPLSGNISLEYAGTSQSRDAVMFTLANGTARAVSFRGTPDPAPGSLTMSCDSAGGEATGYGQGSVDPAVKDKKIEVRPGERLHLKLWTTVPSDFNNHKRRCHLSLKLEGGAVIESPEFIP